MQLIHDGAFQPLKDIILTEKSHNSTFSAIVIVIENRKLEVIKRNTRNEKEKLEIHVADQSCQLFKFTLWGQAAVIASSRFRPGAIMLIDQFIVKARHGGGAAEGHCADDTTTHVLYNKFGISFEEQCFPIMFMRVLELVKFSRTRYPLLYSDYDNVSDCQNKTMLSQLLSSGADSQSLVDDVATDSGHCERELYPRTATGKFPLSTDRHDLMAHNSIVPLLSSNSSRVPIKTFNNNRSLQHQEAVSLRVDKDIKISISDILDFHNDCSSSKLLPRWNLLSVSRRWRAVDARTHEPLFLSFDSKKSAHDRASRLFQFVDGECLNSWAVSNNSPLLIHATNLLILRDGGQSLMHCHNKLTLGNLYSSTIQELLVSEDSTLQELSSSCQARKRENGSHISDERGNTGGRHVKRSKPTAMGTISSPSGEPCRLTLENCRLMSIAVMSIAVFSKPLESKSDSQTRQCENLACDAFLWQLLDVDTATYVDTPLRSGEDAPSSGTEIASSRLCLKVPSTEYRPLYFSFQVKDELVQLPVDNSAFAAVLGNIPAPLLLEALLVPHSLDTSCCLACLPTVKRLRQVYGTIRVLPLTNDGVDEEDALKCITRCVRRVLKSLVRNGSGDMETTLPRCSPVEPTPMLGNMWCECMSDAADTLFQLRGSGEEFSICVRGGLFLEHEVDSEGSAEPTSNVMCFHSFI